MADHFAERVVQQHTAHGLVVDDRAPAMIAAHASIGGSGDGGLPALAHGTAIGAEQCHAVAAHDIDGVQRCVGRQSGFQLEGDAVVFRQIEAERDVGFDCFLQLCNGQRHARLLDAVHLAAIDLQQQCSDQQHARADHQPPQSGHFQQRIQRGFLCVVGVTNTGGNRIAHATMPPFKHVARCLSACGLQRFCSCSLFFKTPLL